jgi:phosphatidate cytidylyltransferase
MLKQRLITAAILIPLVVLGILKLETYQLQWFIGLVTILAAWEWLGIIGIHDITKRLIWVVGLLLVVAVSTYLPMIFILLLALLLWLTATVIILKFGHSGLPSYLADIFKQSHFGIACTLVLLALFWLSVVILHQTPLGPEQLLYVLISVWLADTGGYFAGKRWGKTPLAKAVSPNKTWQGVWGALGLTTAWAAIAYYLGLSGDLSLLLWLCLTLLTVTISIVGDLFESLFKRSFNVKDSGNLLPGHGGILDRIDSLIAAVPVFVAGLMLTGAV